MKGAAPLEYYGYGSAASEVEVRVRNAQCKGPYACWPAESSDWSCSGPNYFSGLKRCSLQLAAALTTMQC